MTELRKQINNIVEDYNACKVLAKSVGNPSVYEGTTATAGDIKAGKTAYSNGELIEGVMDVGNYNVELDITSQFMTQFALMTLLKKVDLSNINTGQLTNFTSAFGRASNMIEVKGIDVSRATMLNSMFYGCSSLVTIPVLNPASVKGANSLTDMFGGCPSLSDESLNNILQMCVNAIVYAGTKTLKQIGLSSAQATVCQGLSNYQAFLDAGWTTGY